jgi:hypothetical protein
MQYVTKINGIYDIACGLHILDYIYIPYVDSIHLNMIVGNETNIIFTRYYAYWILTYGSMRLFTNDTNIIRISYLLEALFTANEYTTRDIYRRKALFVIIVSLLFAYLV